jgi:hypothetical protein
VGVVLIGNLGRGRNGGIRFALPSMVLMVGYGFGKTVGSLAWISGHGMDMHTHDETPRISFLTLHLFSALFSYGMVYGPLMRARSYEFPSIPLHSLRIPQSWFGDEI